MKNKFDLWNKKITELRQVGDKLGLGLDTEILDTVAGLNLNGVITTQSCAGHLDRALAYPWIQIGSSDSQEINDKRDQIQKLRITAKSDQLVFPQLNVIENQVDVLVGKSLKKTIELVTSFYSIEHNVGDERLIVVDFSDSGRLQPQGGCLQVVRNANEKKKKLIHYQNEINRFAQYLKDLYFQKKDL